MLTLIESNIENKLPMENCLGCSNGQSFRLEVFTKSMFTRNIVNKKVPLRQDCSVNVVFYSIFQNQFVIDSIFFFNFAFLFLFLTL